jgi:hypothetical protein
VVRDGMFRYIESFKVGEKRKEKRRKKIFSGNIKYTEVGE